WTKLAGRNQGKAAHADVEAVEKRGRHHDGEQQAHENQGHPERRIFSAEPQQFDQRIDYHALPLLRATGTTPYCTPCRSKWMKPRSSAPYTARWAAMPMTRWEGRVDPATSMKVTVWLMMKGACPASTWHSRAGPASQPRKVMQEKKRLQPAGRSPCSIYLRRMHHKAPQAAMSMASATASATRNDQKVSATGGCMPEKWSSPIRLPSSSKPSHFPPA